MDQKWLKFFLLATSLLFVLGLGFLLLSAFSSAIFGLVFSTGCSLYDFGGICHASRIMLSAFSLICFLLGWYLAAFLAIIDVIKNQKMKTESKMGWVLFLLAFGLFAAFYYLGNLKPDPFAASIRFIKSNPKYLWLLIYTSLALFLLTPVYLAFMIFIVLPRSYFLGSAAPFLILLFFPVLLACALCLLYLKVK